MTGRIIRYSLVFSLLFFILAFPVAASTVTGAGYKGTVIIANSGTATNSNAVPFTCHTAELINGKMLNATASDAALLDGAGNDIAFMPGWSTNPWVLFNSSINQNDHQNNYLYTSGATGGKLRYIPGTGYMTTADSSSLEFSTGGGLTVFAVETKGYVDTAYPTTLGKQLLYKPEAFALDVSNTNTIGAYFLAASTTLGVVNSNANHFSFNDSTKTRAGTRFNAVQGYLVTQAQIYMTKNGSPTGNLSCTIRRVSDDSLLGTLGTLAAYGLSTSATAQTFNTPVYIPCNTDVRVLIEYTEGTASNYISIFGATGAYITTTYTSSTYTDTASRTDMKITYVPVTKSVTATATPGEHTIKAYADSTNLKIDIDGVNQGSVALSGTSVPDNSYNYTSFINNVMPYVEYQKIWIGNNLNQYVYWEYAATFSDHSGSATLHPATPTFPTTSTDPDVTATLSSFGPNVLSSTPVAGSGAGSWDLLPSVPADPGLFTEMNMTFFGAPFCTTFSARTTIPIDLVVISWAFGWALLLGFIAYRVSMGRTSKYQRQGAMPLRPGSLLVQALVSEVVLAYFVIAGGGVIPGWVLIPFAIESVAAIVVRQNGGQALGG